MNNILILVLLHLFNIQFVASGKCPKAEFISPCVCNSNSIQCTTRREIDLPQTFKQLVSESKSDDDLKFETFELINSPLQQLDNDVFNGTKFSKLKFINNAKLTCINVMAFSGLEKTTTLFESIGSSLK